jgi:nucleotide-binding universal stress UspA family protein
VLNFVTGGCDTGRALVASPLTNLVTMTGHRESGKQIMAQAAQHLTRLSPYQWFRADGALRPAEIAAFFADLLLNGLRNEPGGKRLDSYAAPRRPGYAHVVTGKSIVVATDGSAAAVQAVEVALDIAAAKATEVVFVHFSPEAQALFEAAPETGPSQEQIEDADPVLRAAAMAAGARNIPADLVIRDECGTADIAAAIAGIAEAREAEMIVVGTRGHGAVASAVLGSVSRGLLDLSTLPVVIVHAATGAG